ncbi:leucine-rich repeat domain-containing protein [uncultured Brachyspira sp.]|uniref:leucine-rich repeat domain-containing protein n=1 Tax=uncultured Brachyspira sp. TaxID=221953 RepID=UPI00260DDF0C|nr:leucine-rich repeat domain-containing protein [uncultured Brachyspira sp.]
MYKKIILLILCLIFVISCSSPSNPDNGNQGNNGDGGSTPPPITTPTEEELIAKYGIDIGQADAEISKQIEANLKAYYTEMGSYRVIFTGTTANYGDHESLYALTLKAALKVSSSMNIELDIKNINFQDGSVKTGMFSGEVVDNSQNIVISFAFPTDKIKTIEMMSFDNLYNTKEIVIPDSVITISDMAFQNSQSIEILNLGNSVQTIGEYAFMYIEGLKEVIIPASVTSIGMGAFSGGGLEKITISAPIKTMGMGVFLSSLKLTTVTYYGTSPTDINNNDAFLYCDKLTTLIVPNATNPNDNAWKTFLGGNFTDVRKE